MSDSSKHQADTEPDTLHQTFSDAQRILKSGGTPVTLAASSTQPTIPHINHYRLMHPIGEGGMGSVWLAEQNEPVKRRVAIKVIKAGLDTSEVIARFEAERQALAMMDHPNIARILDAGSTESGRPFFVMEYIQGRPLTKYADENSLSTRERLALFATVCRAVQHAHQKGILHRDIKPSNVLVTTHDNQPVVKIIDFGLAKAMDSTLTDKSIYTTFGMPLGTLIYASPEQVEGRLPDIDTRSDVFSLGVTLYELLTGSTPIEKELFQGVAPQEIAQMICEEDPPKPSSRLSSHADRLTSISSLRGTRPHQLTVQVRGELDWIVMRAIERDRSDRYQSPSELADDVERFLIGQPVEAGPPRFVYRAKKYIKRNKLAVSLAAITVVALVATSIASLIVASTISSKNRTLVQRNEEIEGLLDNLRTKNAQVASQNSALVEKAERIEALAELANQSIGSFLLELTQDPRMLAQVGTNSRRTRLQEAQDILAQVSKLADDDNSPTVEAKAHLYTATSDAELGDLEDAVVELDLAIESLKVADDDDETLILLAKAYRNLGYFNQKLERYPEAEAAHAAATSLLERERSRSPEFLLELAIGLTYFGETKLAQDQYKSALKKFLESKDVFDQLGDADLDASSSAWSDWKYFFGMNQFNVAIGYEMTGDEETARDFYLDAVRVFDELFLARPDQPRVHSRRVRAYLNLASDFHETEEFKNAKKTAMTGRDAAQTLRQYPHVLEFQFQIVRADYILFLSHMYLGEEREGTILAKSGLEKIERLRSQFESLGDLEEIVESYESTLRSVLP